MTGMTEVWVDGKRFVEAKEWIGLSDEEFDQISEMTRYCIPHTVAVWLAVEVKLREKNN